MELHGGSAQCDARGIPDRSGLQIMFSARSPCTPTARTPNSGSAPDSYHQIRVPRHTAPEHLMVVAQKMRTPGPLSLQTTRDPESRDPDWAP